MFQGQAEENSSDNDSDPLSSDDENEEGEQAGPSNVNIVGQEPALARQDAILKGPPAKSSRIE